MAILDTVKLHLRLSDSTYDTEITSLINGAKAELEASGAASPVDELDPLVERAITIYSKMHFGLSGDRLEKYSRAFDMLKQTIALTQGDDDVE